MASIQVRKTNTGEEVSVTDVDLESDTALELIEAAVEAAFLPPFKDDRYSDNYYCILGKDGRSIYFDEWEKTLSELGFIDGDTIHIIWKAIY